MCTYINSVDFMASMDDILGQKDMQKMNYIFLLSLVTVMFAADLAEMLSVDMQKEGLSGRTLTLKLKTTTFEVLFVAPLWFSV